MDLQLSGMTFLVTGASGGIGYATAEALAAEGAGLALLAGKRGRELANRVVAGPLRHRAVVLEADLRDPMGTDAAFSEAREALGRLDGLVVSHGVWPPEDERLDRMAPQRLASTIAVNLLGAAWCVRAFMRELNTSGPRPDGRGASVVLVGSTAGRFGEAGHADYAISKAGLYGLMLSAKNELSTIDPYGRINLLEPGWTATEMAAPALETPGTISRVLRTMALRQVARAEDVARAIVGLLSPALSRHVTGERLTVAGGMEGRVLHERETIDEEAVRARLEEKGEPDAKDEAAGESGEGGSER